MRMVASIFRTNDWMDKKERTKKNEWTNEQSSLSLITMAKLTHCSNAKYGRDHPHKKNVISSMICVDATPAIISQVSYFLTKWGCIDGWTTTMTRTMTMTMKRILLIAIIFIGVIVYFHEFLKILILTHSLKLEKFNDKRRRRRRRRQQQQQQQYQQGQYQIWEHLWMKGVNNNNNNNNDNDSNNNNNTNKVNTRFDSISGWRAAKVQATPPPQSWATWPPDFLYTLQILKHNALCFKIDHHLFHWF